MLNVDIATLLETRLADSGSLKKDYTFYWQGKCTNEATCFRGSFVHLPFQ